MSRLLGKVEALLLLSIGGFIGYLFASGKSYYYLTDQNRWLFLLSSVLFVVLGGYNIFSGRLAGKPLRVILFLLVLLMALLIPPRIIGPADLLQSPFNL